MTNSSQRQSPRLRSAPTGASISSSPSLEVTPSQPRTMPVNQLATASEPSAPAPAVTARRFGPPGAGQRFTNSRANTPLFGSLNVRNAVFYCKATVTQLKTIVASAPHHLRSHLPSSPTKDMLLETVLSLRQEEAVNSRLNQRTPQQSLNELMELSADQLKALASADTAQLGELMKAALQADPQMRPRDIPTSAETMVITVLTWQIEAHKSAHAALDSPPPPAPDLAARGSTSVHPPRRHEPLTRPPYVPRRHNKTIPTSPPYLALNRHQLTTQPCP